MVACSTTYRMHGRAMTAIRKDWIDGKSDTI
jgi:hypothetical protein